MHKAGVEPEEAEKIMLSLVERMDKWNKVKVNSKLVVLLISSLELK